MMPVRDAVLLLEMPERVLKEANDVAEVHFQGRARVSLQGFIAHGLRENLYVLLGDATPDDALCPFKKLYSELLRGENPSVKGLIVLQYTAKVLPQRAYDIFLMHAKLAGEEKMSVRLMPFPSTWMLRIICNSDVCRVEVPPLFERTFTKRELDSALMASVLSEVWEKIADDRESMRMPRTNEADAIRYLKLRLPLEKLEAQDAY